MMLMTANTAKRLVLVAVVLGAVGGCYPSLVGWKMIEPGTLASIKARFKATIQAELPGTPPLDWGPGDGNLWTHAMGPLATEVCGRPVNAPAAQVTYQINYFQDFLGSISDGEVVTPAHPPDASFTDHCGGSPP